LTLKLIADAGLIGLPSAGKSSLLNALTRAKAKVGDYPFTTLEPNLGDFYGYVLADVPGLIEGAAEGKGLGTKFLKHIERTKMLLHLVSADQENPVDAYQSVRQELKAFGRGLPEKSEILVISKADLLTGEALDALKKELEAATGGQALAVSIIDDALLQDFSAHLSRLLAREA
jgi:GTP-binding protein